MVILYGMLCYFFNMYLIRNFNKLLIFLCNGFNVIENEDSKLRFGDKISFIWICFVSVIKYIVKSLILFIWIYWILY